MANTVQKNSFIWRYFTSKEPFIKCNICNVLYKSNDILFNINLLKKHLEQKHSHIIEEIKKQIKSTWLSRFFAFDIKYESIRCIFCEDDIRVLEGINNLRYHMLCHNTHEDSGKYLKFDDVTMQQNLPPEIYEKIIQKKRDEITVVNIANVNVSFFLSHSHMHISMYNLH